MVSQPSVANRLKIVGNTFPRIPNAARLAARELCQRRGRECLAWSKETRCPQRRGDSQPALAAAMGGPVRTEQMGGDSRGCGCCTCGPVVRIPHVTCGAMGSYGDSNPRPLACHESPAWSPPGHMRPISWADTSSRRHERHSEPEVTFRDRHILNCWQPPVTPGGRTVPCRTGAGHRKCDGLARRARAAGPVDARSQSRRLSAPALVILKTALTWAASLVTTA